MPGYAITVTPNAVEGPLWTALSAASAPASIAELRHACRADPSVIHHRLSRWVLAGLVQRLEGTPKRYAMNDTTQRTPVPPRVDSEGRITLRHRSTRDRLWSAMRVLRSFDLPKLLISVPEATRRSAEDYVNRLARSGHLRVIKRGCSMRGDWSTYALVRNTGRRAPKVTHALVAGQRRREVVDLNDGTRTDISPGAVRLRSKPAAADADGGVS